MEGPPMLLENSWGLCSHLSAFEIISGDEMFAAPLLFVIDF